MDIRRVHSNKDVSKTEKYFYMIQHPNTAIQPKNQPSSKLKTGEMRRKATLVETLRGHPYFWALQKAQKYLQMI
jgi:hypothetical protein